MVLGKIKKHSLVDVILANGGEFETSDWQYAYMGIIIDIEGDLYVIFYAPEQLSFAVFSVDDDEVLIRPTRQKKDTQNYYLDYWKETIQEFEMEYAETPIPAEVMGIDAQLITKGVQQLKAKVKSKWD